jgi:glucose/arabinose dehydrogenase
MLDSARIPRWAARVAGALLALAPAALPAPLQAAGLELVLDPVASGFDLPVGIVHAGDGSGRLFVVEQSGAVRIVRGGAVLPRPFLDLSGQVSCCGERGLLGLAFHPRYPGDPRLFVHFTDPAGDTRLVEFRVSGADPDRADPASARTLLAVGQPFPNHNGGQLAFGPDGYLYVALGDGGSGGDPFDHAQSLTTLLGKILRIDVDRTDPGLAYAIPPDNPSWPGVPFARREIWAYGLRNPWRFSFDRATGDLLVADVGQRLIEEVDLLPAGRGGLNLGWRRKEGDQCFQPPAGCEALPGLTDPILTYSHALGCSVTGGYRYRGGASPRLRGIYLFGDFCSGRIWSAAPGAGGAWSATQLLDVDFALSTFGEDEAGEVYAAAYAGAPKGRIYRLREVAHEPPPPPPPPTVDGWMRTPEIPGFRFKVRILAGGEEQPVRREADCLPETLCVSGAIPGRSELFVRVVGPKPNGRLWPTLVRFSTSAIEVDVDQLATGITRQYVLPAAAPGASTLDGLFDRDGFEP